MKFGSSTIREKWCALDGVVIGCGAPRGSRLAVAMSSLHDYAPLKEGAALLILPSCSIDSAGMAPALLAAVPGLRCLVPEPIAERLKILLEEHYRSLEQYVHAINPYLIRNGLTPLRIPYGEELLERMLEAIEPVPPGEPRKHMTPGGVVELEFLPSPAPEAGNSVRVRTPTRRLLWLCSPLQDDTPFCEPGTAAFDCVVVDAGELLCAALACASYQAGGEGIQGRILREAAGRGFERILLPAAAASPLASTWVRAAEALGVRVVVDTPLAPTRIASCLGAGEVQIVDSRAASMELNREQGRLMLMAGAESCEMGRMPYHLKHWIWKKETLVLASRAPGEWDVPHDLHQQRHLVTILGENVARKCTTMVLAYENDVLERAGRAVEAARAALTNGGDGLHAAPWSDAHECGLLALPLWQATEGVRRSCGRGSEATVLRIRELRRLLDEYLAATEEAMAMAEGDPGAKALEADAIRLRALVCTMEAVFSAIESRLGLKGACGDGAHPAASLYLEALKERIELIRKELSALERNIDSLVTLE